MTKRSFGVTVLAFSTIMVALYSQYAAISLVVTGSVFAPSGELVAMITFATGAAFMVLTAAGYIAGVGLWTRKSWSWTAAVGIYIGFFVANAFLSALAANFASAVLPTIGVALALVFLHRPQVRAELGGQAVATSAPAPSVPAVEVPRPAH